MSHHNVKINDHWYRLLSRGIKNYELRFDDRDYQTGDTIRMQASREWMHEDRTIVHVLKNIDGLAPGWVVLSFNDPDREYLRERKEALFAESETLRRSNASLRGQITKLRKRIGAQA